MASSSPIYQYLLPGERTTSSSIVHHHGSSKSVSSVVPKQSPENNFLFVSRIYKPKENDHVVGIVLLRTPDLFLVDINSSEPAILPLTSFDRGRLPSRNTMNRFSAVYARVVCADAWTQTELSCEVDHRSRKRSNFGLLEQGHILRCSVGLCRKLQRSPLVNQFYRIVRNFDICLTQNGIVWYQTDTISAMIAVKNIIQKHEWENDVNHLLDVYKNVIDQLEEQENKSEQQQLKIKENAEIKPTDQLK